MRICNIPGKLEVTWRSEANAIIDSWKSYEVTLSEFKNAIIDKGLNFAEAKKVKSWIVDSAEAEGGFSNEIQGFISNEVFPKMAEIGIKNLITINSKQSTVNRISSNMFKSKLGPNGIKLVEVDTIENAVEWARNN